MMNPNSSNADSAVTSVPPSQNTSGTNGSNHSSRRKKRRWGDAPPSNGGGGGNHDDDASSPAKLKSRFSSPPTAASTSSTTEAPPPSKPATVAASSVSDAQARKAALQASIQARLAALKARTAAAAPAPIAKPSTTPKPAAKTPAVNDKKRQADESTTSKSKEAKRARVFELDLSVTAPTRLIEKQAREEQLRSIADGVVKKKVNPYLAHREKEEEDAAAAATASTASSKDGKGKLKSSVSDLSAASASKKSEGEVLLDTRLAGGHVAKTRLHHRPLNFVEPGTYIALGEKKRQAAARAEESGYLSGRKDGRVVKSVGMGGGVGAGGGAVEIADESGQKGGYYGVGEAGKMVEERLAARADAPELEVEDILGGGKKNKMKFLESTPENKHAAVLTAIVAAESAMPYAMEWWDAELLPSKLRKELALEEGKAIANRARKQGGIRGEKEKEKEDSKQSQTATDPANSTSQQQSQFEAQKEQHQKLIERCYKHANLTHSRTHTLVQHPVPILTPAQKLAQEAAQQKAPTLHLTKAERKRHRKLRRAERLREQQDLQAAGLLPPPEPRLTLSNYMKVLGDQAVLDPSKMEARVMEQIQARKMKHEQMNEERKLTKEQKAEKHRRKLKEDTSLGVKVALFWVRDMGHPYHRAKVDLNAQQNEITGGVLECEVGEGGGDNNVVLVVAEGGEKAIKRYIRLMTVRMRWKGEDFYESDEDEDMGLGETADDGNAEGEGEQTKQERKKFNPNNECELIWTGMAVKRAFHSFMFQSAANPTVARKILEAKGVAHYWDLVVGHVEAKENGGMGGMGVGDGGALKFRLGSMNDNGDAMD